jgi:hypothetical protein
LQKAIGRHRTLSSKPFGSQQGVDEVDEQAECDYAAQEIVQDHVFLSAKGLPLKPLTAHDVGQASGKKDHCQDQKEDIEHVRSLPTEMVFDTTL